MKIWWRHHAYALRQTWRNLRVNLGGFALNVLVLAIAFALPLAGLTVLENIRPLSQRLVVAPELSVFLSTDLSREKALALQPAIQQVLQTNQHAGKVIFLPREKALADLKQKSGLTAALAMLGENPLPDGYLVSLPRFANAAAAASIDPLAEQLRGLPGVAQVQVDSLWIKRLAALLHLIDQILGLLAATLAVVVITVVFNTIRLQVVTQSEEIAVSRLLGATDGFIYRPFYYTGALLGASAAALALGAVALLLYPLNNAVAGLVRLYAAEFTLTPLDPLATVALLALGAALGIAGALLAVSRHLATRDM